MRERNLHRRAVERARQLGCYVIVNTSPPCDVGTADWSLLYAGLWCSVELKPEGEDLTPAQREHARQVLAAGGRFAVVRRAADVDRLVEQMRTAARSATIPRPTATPPGGPR